MRVLDLFSGIGGFSLGLERAGMKTIQFVEIEPYCQAVLRKHWPDVPIHDDIKTFHAPAGFADVICGGFPCQDISTAGKGAGLAGARSGLWSEYARLIGEIRPRYVIVENVAALLGRGLGTVLGDLAALGYDAEWHCIPASSVGAPHRRDRIWILAYPMLGSRSTELGQQQGERATLADSSGEGNVAHAEGTGFPARPDCEAIDVPDTNGPNVERGGASRDAQGRQEPDGHAGLAGGVAGTWAAEPNVGRVAHGVPNRVDRLKSLGNAVVPQIPELIGRAIMSAA